MYFPIKLKSAVWTEIIYRPNTKTMVKVFTLTSLILISFVSSCPASAEKVEYIIYDGQNYGQNQIESAISSPVLTASPYNSGNDYIIPRASDGHFYIAGSVNGFPVVFMVDTGASISVLPAKFVRNAGIRAGRMVYANTAAGQSRAGLSQGNVLLLGPYKPADVKVGVNDKLDTPLLGMDVLNRFQITQSNGMLVLRANR